MGDSSRSSSVGKAATVLVVGMLGLLIFFTNHYFGARLMGDMVNRDLMHLVAGGRALIQGLDPYDPQEWSDLLLRLGAVSPREPICLYPLWTLLLCIPLSFLPYSYAVSVWMTASELALALSVFLVLTAMDCRRGRWVVFPAFIGGLAFRPFVASLTSGQIAPFLLLAMAGAVALYAREHRWWSGIALAFLILKPNPFVLFLPAAGLLFLVRRDWRALGGLATGVVVLFAVSWLASPGWLPRWLDVSFKGEVTFGTPTLWGIAFDLAGPEGWKLVGGLAAALLGTAVVGVVIWRREDWAFGLNLAMCGSLLVTPYLWNYDQLILLVPALVAFCYAHGRRLPRIALWLFVLWVVPWVLFLVANWRSFDSLSALVTVAVTVYLCWAFWSSRRGEGAE